MVTTPKPTPIVVKRYASRRLYEPANGRYVSVQQLREWHAAGVAVVVTEAETGADVTDSLVT